MRTPFAPSASALISNSRDPSSDPLIASSGRVQQAVAPCARRLIASEHQGSIYENQRAGGRRYFATPDQAPRIAAE
jgi:hypothetical protein